MRIAMCLQDLAGGGAERVAVTLINELASLGCEVELGLVRKEGPYLSDVAPSVEIRALAGGRTAFAVPAIAGWIRTFKPDVVVAHLTHMNVAAAMAGMLAGRVAPTIVVEHNQMDLNYARVSSSAVKQAYRATRWAYKWASRVVCVSQGVADSVAAFAALPQDKLVVKPNPVLPKDIAERIAAKPAHPWLAEKISPTLVACGRLVEQKGFDTLLSALAILRRQKDVRLVLLGQGPLQEALERQASDLGITDAVDFAGFRSDTLACFAASDAFVLSSNWEGMPTVLIEAMASGAPVVATDCRSGPRELLRDGALGPLTTVGNADALAQAILNVLSAPGDAVVRRASVEPYRADRAAEAYLALFQTVAAESAHR